MAVSGANAASGVVARLPGALTAGEITTVAGGAGGPGPATKVGLAYWPGEYPCATATHSGGLFVTDGDASSDGTFYGQQMTAGHVYALAGTVGAGSTGDGVPATSAELISPVALAVDSAGNVLIDDSTSARIRVVAASTGVFYGQAMTAGDIYTIAGNGTTGYSGDGGPATSAEFALPGPGSVAADSTGNLLISDSGNNQIRVAAAKTGTYYGVAMTAGDIYSITPASGSGPAVSAPGGVSLDGAGNVVFTNDDAEVSGDSEVDVQAVTTGSFYGRAMTAGQVDRIAGTVPPVHGGFGIPAKAGWPPGRCCLSQTLWRWTPRATCSSVT
jgi:NHL repeat-containing protein